MQYRAKATLLALVASIVFIPSVEAQTTGSLPSVKVNLAKKESASGNKPNATQESSRKEKRPFTFFFKLATVFESNIEHDVVAVRSYGLVPSFGFNYQNDWSKNSVELNYEAASHSTPTQINGTA